MDFGDFPDLLDNMLQGAVRHTGMPIPGSRWKTCLELFDDGWVQDGFDYVPDGHDMIFYWKKEGEERKQVLLTLEEQQLWIRALTKRGLMR